MSDFSAPQVWSSRGQEDTTASWPTAQIAGLPALVCERLSFLCLITGKDACEIAYNGELLEEGALGSERKLEHYQAATNHGSEGK